MVKPEKAGTAKPEKGGEGPRAQGWCALSVLHNRIHARTEKALQAEHRLSVTEFSVLNILGQQAEHHMRMQRLATTVALSQSATTRVVNRLEEQGLLSRYLCPTDRRGIYTEVTAAGRKALERARPTHDAALAAALGEAEQVAELVPLVRALAEIESA